MSRLIQTQTRPDLIPEEQKSLHITQWKFIIPRNNGIEVCVSYSVYFIFKMTLQMFNQINHEKVATYHAYDYLRSALICVRCGGTGIVDWIDKATTGKIINNSVRNLDATTKYVRNKKGPVYVFHDYNNRNLKIYTSTPRKRIGDEYCDDCLGCSIKFHSFSFEEEVTEFYPS